MMFGKLGQEHILPGRHIHCCPQNLVLKIKKVENSVNSVSVGLCCLVH